MITHSIKISIVIPTLNVESSIRDCIKSLINQNFSKDQYEIIVVDGESKDNTFKILKEYSKHISIHVYKGGVSCGRNKGIEVSKGNIIAFTDGDCIAEKNWIKELYSKFETDTLKCVGCVVGNIIPHDGKTIFEIFALKNEILSQKKTMNSDFLPYGQTANVSFRKEVFDNIGKFDETINSGEDADIAWRMQLETNYKLVYCQESIVKHCHRTSLKGLAKQCFKYGIGKSVLYKKFSKSIITSTNTNKSNVNKNLINNLSKLTEFSICILPRLFLNSLKRLTGSCDKYQMYEPLLMCVYTFSYGLGKIYGSLKLRNSVFSAIFLK